MLKCFILFLVHLQSYFYIGNSNVIDLSIVPFDGPKRGPEMTVEGGGNQGQQGMNSDRAKQYYVENINIVQEDIAMRWPLGIVPYYFDLSSYDVLQRPWSRRDSRPWIPLSPWTLQHFPQRRDYVMNSRTREAMDIIEAVSCVRFTSVLLKPDNNSWIHITNPDGVRECMHKPIYKGFEVIVNLGLECLTRREIVHTLLHAIGFPDEVTHPQRDQYIRVVWENIQPRYKILFRRQPDEGPSKSLVEFDPMSIMQFHDRAFSRNGYATIAGLLPGLQIRPSEGLSQLDKMKLRLLFGHECNRRSVDDLLDTCKKEFRNDQPTNGAQSSDGNDKDKPSPEESSVVSDNEGNDGNDVVKVDGTKKPVALKDESQEIQSDDDVADATTINKHLPLKDEVNDKDDGNDKDIGNDKESDDDKENAYDKDNANDEENANDKENANNKENANDKDNANDKENAKEGSAPSGIDGAGNDVENDGDNKNPHKLNTEDVGTQYEVNEIDEDVINFSHNDDNSIVDKGNHTPFHLTESDHDKEQPINSYENSNIEIDDRIGTIAESKRRKLKKY